jgi:hypothetical protein
MVLVTTPEEVVTLAHGTVTVVGAVTVMVLPPTVAGPAGMVVEVAPQTTVVSVMTTVVAGTV